MEAELKNTNSVFANIIVASTKKISFSDKWLKNCTAGRWAGSDTVKSRFKSSKDIYRQSYIPDRVVLKKGNDTEAYGTLSKIVYNGGNIDIDAIRSRADNKEQADTEINKQTDKINGMDISNGKMQFIYHTGAYYTMSSKACQKYASFIGKDISDIKFVYSRSIKDHNRENKVKMRALSPDKYSSDCISFKYQKGTIVNVLSKGLKNGSGYDGRDDDSENGDGKLFDTVRGYVPKNNTLTVEKLKGYAESVGAVLRTQYSDDYIVKSVAVNGKSNVTEFKNGDKLTITAAPKPTPKPTRKPVVRNDNKPVGITPKKVIPKKRDNTSNRNSEMNDGTKYGKK